MVRLIIVGTEEIASVYIDLIQKHSSLKINAIIVNHKVASVVELANTLHIDLSDDFSKTDISELDFIVYPRENGEFLKLLREDKQLEFMLTENKSLMLNDIIPVSHGKHPIEILCNNLHTGIIYIDTEAKIRFINQKAHELLALDDAKLIGEDIQQILPQSRLPVVLESRRNELYQSFTLNNGVEMIGSRFPLINSVDHLEGAYMIFEKKSSLTQISKQITEVDYISGALQTILQTSDELITVVNEDCVLEMCTVQFAEVVGVKQDKLLGEEATAAMFEGNLLHMDTLADRRAVKDVHINIGGKTYIGRAAPIIVDGKLKGSIACYSDITNELHMQKELQFTKNIVRKLDASFSYKDLIFKSADMNDVLEQAKYAANTNLDLCIKGEEGTEKHLLANAIHHESNRKYNQFIHVKCFKQSINIQEAFHQGKGGTIYLDCLEMLSIDDQRTLLELLETRSSKKLDVRLITSMNQQIENDDRLLKGLSEKLQTITIHIPPLHRRKEDLKPLTSHLLIDLNRNYHKNIVSISKAANDLLLEYHWPGNVKEFETVLSHAVTLMDIDEQEIQEKHLPSLLYYTGQQKDKEALGKPKPLQRVMDEYERSYIQKVYREQNNNKTKTAKVLGISVRNLYYKIEKYHLDEESIK